MTAAVLAPPLARRVASIGVSMGTALTIVAGVLLVLTTPFYMHPALDQSQSAAYLGTAPATAHQLSDLTIHELYLGPGTFAFSWTPGGTVQPFYDAAEIQHLQAVHVVLFGFLALAVIGALLLVVGLATVRGAAWFWRAVARGAGWMGVAFVVIGAFAAVAFEQAFTLFHEIFFPGGDWSFDPATEHLVQLYPTPFWELTAAVLVGASVFIGLVVWWFARARAARLEAAPPPGASA
ncbi:MAG TPA: DUF1461 domain-containing protein [Candidatus Baltobacteraceae bacterium]|nr:DUF1461 domain-containing protein [Candidatus Baltobacteraceae bacterium]